jgi:hypothetical protein
MGGATRSAEAGHMRASRDMNRDMNEVVFLDTRDQRKEIWGQRSLVRRPMARRVEQPTPEEIWGSAQPAAEADVTLSESIWGESPEAGPPPPSPSSTNQQSFVLTDSWAAAPRRPRWMKRLDSLGRLSRRTG